MPVFAIPFPMIDPVAVQLGPLAIKWYGLAYVVGLLGGWWYARKLVAADGLWGGRARPQAIELDDMLLFVAFGVVLGGRIGFVLFYDLARYLERPQDIFAIWQGGMSFHGGLIGATLGLWLFAKRRGYPALSVFDLAAAVVPIGLLLGRIANFINGELWGRPAPDFPYAMVFPNGGPLPRHPSQLYEAFGEGLLLFILVNVLVRFGGFRRPGFVAGVFGMGYAVARIVCEFFREPDPQLGFLFGTSVDALSGGITMGMLLSLPVFFAGLWLVLRSKREVPGEARA
ncbi:MULTISPECIES: prolipoprotein diacylglyceryl transferase [Bosea]|uniref:prolipoprotein diacylglyceryl transferase n=1 Tax=Bosea TaxID=85413 RepID=UPI00215001DC|nr:MULTISPECIES: prolipoprotein diacylglyceryl transferase [Bosea]MCR4520161.1 prolipoprotein diacylglyceryl transferase [Bosea sp. 47.2.35]MDR6829727.1 phosphatidylglycerol:prolipoprotein diacylglycerol transferase [Bosea robiniae]MDR6896610.1 phosphatidylglycerol:prolipoprotein diacylglycerol transferase [Bosea sp. BE109]MDR7140008.1 phosphatidylglycerol:prolipoprotein diacylglycerol transferase [Bosea sp. BE168]MDR7176678.1 phosphatidylglycerol:prolipoprotein diacylglycerol transferase [Bos